MPNVNRYRTGEAPSVSLPTANDGVVTKSIQKGDLVYQDGGIAYPATYLADAGTAAQNRAAFAAAFVGVAKNRTGLKSGETVALGLTPNPGHVELAQEGVYEYPCAATAFVPGDLVGIYAPSDDSKIVDAQKVAKVTTYAEAIGTAEVPYNALGTTMTAVRVRLRSTLIHNEILSGQ